METCTGKDLGDPSGPHRGTEHFESAHEVFHELGEPVDGLAHLDERIGTLVVEAFGPRRVGQRGDEESSRRLRQGPASSGPQLEDREPLGRG